MSKRRLIVGILALVVLLIGAVAVYALTRDEDEETRASLFSAADKTAFETVDGLLPTQETLGLPAVTYALDEARNRIYTLDEAVDDYRFVGLEGVADAYLTTGQRDGLVGRLSRAWSSGDNCLDPASLLDFQVDVTLFKTAEGAAANVSDPALRQAWLDSGRVTRYREAENIFGTQALGGVTNNCGDLPQVSVTSAQGRYVITVTALGGPDAQEFSLLARAADINRTLARAMEAAGAQ